MAGRHGPARRHGLLGGEGYLTGADRAGRGSGAWVGFDARRGATVRARIGISYVSAAGAIANRDGEVTPRATVASVAAGTRASWNRELSRLRVGGGTTDRTTQLYTSVYHALMQPNTLNDRDGRYLGPDQRVHRMDRGHRAVYGTYSGWDQYGRRSSCSRCCGRTSPGTWRSRCCGSPSRTAGVCGTGGCTSVPRRT